MTLLARHPLAVRQGHERLEVGGDHGSRVGFPGRVSRYHLAGFD